MKQQRQAAWVKWLVERFVRRQLVPTLTSSFSNSGHSLRRHFRFPKGRFWPIPDGLASSPGQQVSLAHLDLALNEFDKLVREEILVWLPNGRLPSLLVHELSPLIER